MNFKYIWNGGIKVIKKDSNKYEKEPILSDPNAQYNQ